MSILLSKKSKVICQGITGSSGSLHTRLCKEYGTNMVGGVTPGKGGQDFEGTPIFDTVKEAVDQKGAEGYGRTAIARWRAEAGAETPHRPRLHPRRCSAHLQR